MEVPMNAPVTSQMSPLLTALLPQLITDCRLLVTRQSSLVTPFLALFTCHLPQVNQSITFQNWHSLGLDSLPKGLPLRVTGGNSAPNPTKGSPRLSTVWYSDFQTGNASVPASIFKKPSWLCIPVGREAVEVMSKA